MSSVALAKIGHNSPPEALGTASEVMTELSSFMSEHPVIEQEDEAREAKKLLDRAKGCTGDIEAERTKSVRPLNDQVDAINARYLVIHNENSKKPGTLDKIINELKARVSTFIRSEEARKEREADIKRREALLAEEAARAAAEHLRESIENARAGELGVDVTQVVVEADQKAAAYNRSIRESARADRDTKVKVGGGWQRAVSLRTKETLILTDAQAALKAVGVTDKIREAILSASREYRVAIGNLPEGVSSEITREL